MSRRLLLTILGLVACSEMPTRFLLPEVPVTVQLPLIDSLLSLESLIEDTAQLHVDAGTGNIALALEGELTSVSLSRELGRIGELRLEQAFQLDEVAALREPLEGWTHVAAELPLTGLFPQLPEPPASSVIPSTGVPVLVDSALRLPPEVLAVAYRGGELRLVLGNNYPVPLVLDVPPGYGQSGVVLRTPGHGEWFFPLTEAQRTIPPGETRGRDEDPDGAIRVPLSGVVLSQASRLLLSLSSPGSAGNRVDYTAASVLQVFVSPQDVTVEWAQVLPGAWETELVVELSLPNGAEVSAGELRAFAAHMELKNGFPVGFHGEWRFRQLRRNGEPVSWDFVVPAFSEDSRRLLHTDPLLLVPEPDDQGSVRSLRVSTWLRVQPPGGPVYIRAEQELTVRVVVENCSLGWARGERLPVANFEVQAESEVWLRGNLGLLAQVEVELAELIVETHLENTAAVGFRVEGRAEIADRNKNVLASLPILPQSVLPALERSGTVLPQRTLWELRYSDVRLTARPRFVRFFWTITPEERGSWFFADTSQLRGYVQVLIPIRIRVHQLSYENEWTFTGGAELRRQGRRVERATVIVEVRNRFPVALRFHLVLADTLGFVRIPPEGEMFFAAAPVTVSGVAEAEQHSLQRFELDERHIPGILRAERLSIALVAHTPAQQYVRLRTSDYVRLRAMLRAELVVP
ncbi:MAG: hypothetical protein NZ949_00415 [Candidatus Kapabacteria bacterium]|nr:hypothetical protein [Candidatus Kapabacteria bacterium]MDW7997105.1 hypothetical protein [Bacteroidota bacterium]